MSPDERASAERIYHRTIVPSSDEVNLELLELVAELEGAAVEDLPPFWNRMDHLLEHVYSTPPDPEAQIRLQFTYAGYRIGLDQSGHVELMKVGDETPRAR
jgi:hypothetical protein